MYRISCPHSNREISVTDSSGAATLGAALNTSVLIKGSSPACFPPLFLYFLFYADMISSGGKTLHTVKDHCQSAVDLIHQQTDLQSLI